MSTNYTMRCGACKEQGGYFTRQAWGWGNADVIENTVFLMAHADCYDRYQGDEDEHLEIISEHDHRDNYDEENLKWIENLQNPETVAGSAFPRGDEWKLVQDGGDIRAWWQAHKDNLTERADDYREGIAERQGAIEAKRALRKHLEDQLHFDIEKRVAECIEGGGHHWDTISLSVQDGNKMARSHSDICSSCGLTSTGAMIQ